MTFDEEVRHTNAKKSQKARLSVQYRQNAVSELLTPQKQQVELCKRSPRYINTPTKQEEIINTEFRQTVTRCSSLSRHKSQVTGPDFYQKLRTISRASKPRIVVTPSENYIFESKKYNYKNKNRGSDNVALYK